MNENTNRASQIVEAEQTINTLSTELLKYKADSNTWKIEVDVELVVNSLGVPDIHVTAKTGKRGVSTVISNESAAYFSADPETIIDDLTRKILIDVLSDQLKSDLGAKLKRALINAKQMKTSSL